MTNRLAFALTFSVALLGMRLEAYAETAYRYKDENGHWQFTDKKPKQVHDELTLNKTAEAAQPRLHLANTSKGKQLLAKNPWYAPVTFGIYVEDILVFSWVAAPQSDAPVFKNEEDRQKISNKKYSYKFRLGKVIENSDGMALRPPIPKTGKFLVSQGFNGQFSHNHLGSKYAVDIAMAVSDTIHAARDGIVVFAKDDYHMGGTDKFFLDKANLITILHSDDTFGVYAHILLGSAMVKPGDRVKAGDPLANAGTSGYSTGPHLHFAVQYNNGKARVSSPFQFQDKNGISSPKYKQWLQIEEDQ